MINILIVLTCQSSVKPPNPIGLIMQPKARKADWRIIGISIHDYNRCKYGEKKIISCEEHSRLIMEMYQVLTYSGTEHCHRTLFQPEHSLCMDAARDEDFHNVNLSCKLLETWCSVHICKAFAQRSILNTFFFFYSAKLALNEALPQVHPREDTIMCCLSRNPSPNREKKKMKFLLKLASESGSIYELSIKVQVARV